MMKNRPSVFLIGLASVATAAYFAASAVGQTPATTPAPSVPQQPPNGSVSAPPPGNGNMPTPGMAYGVSEVLKMYQGGINKDVILHYIHNTTLPFHVTADNIIYLHGLGMPEEIVRTLIERDGQLQQQAMRAYQQQGPPPGYGQQPPAGYDQQPPPGYGQQPPPGDQSQVVTPTTPAPVVTAPYVYDYGAPYYDYAYPYYYYGYWPAVGWGWGWGGRGWGWGGHYGGGWGRGGVGGFRGGGGFHGGGGHGGGGHR
jgi:uncharacterized membrane protein YgcG